MKTKLVDFLVKISYYPRLIIDSVIFKLITNDYGLLNKFKGRDCLIVGNGPSVNNTPLEEINMPSIGMNKINLLFPRSKWRPDLIVCVNGLVIRQNREFFNSTTIPLLLPIKALYLGVRKRPNVIFVRISNSKHFDADITKGLAIGSTVTYSCLQVAAFAGVKSVNIVGVDHNFTKQGDNIEIHKGDDFNHFDPNYFKDKLWGLPDLDGSEFAYRQAKAYFDQANIPIVDYTVNGKLTVFPKGQVKEIVTTKSVTSS